MKRHDNAIIWLQPDEEEGSACCGCRLINDEEGARFIMCPAHNAYHEAIDAVELLRTCLIEAHFDELANYHYGEEAPCSYCQAIEHAEAFIKKARGE